MTKNYMRKIFTITNHQANSNPNHNEKSLLRMVISKKAKNNKYCKSVCMKGGLNIQLVRM